MSEQRQRRSKAPQTPLTPAPSWEQPDQDAFEVDLVDLLYWLLEKWKLILCVTLACTLLAGLCTIYLITPQYEATSIIYVLGNSDSAINLSDLQIGNALTQDYVKVFKLWEIQEQVISNLNLPYTYEEMRERLTVKNDADTRMIDITFTSPSAQEAAAVANEYARVTSQYIADTMSTEKPNIMSVALVPANPASPSLAVNLVIGFMAGAFISCLYVVLTFILDDKFKTSDDIFKYTGLTTLAVVYKEPAEDKQARRRA